MNQRILKAYFLSEEHAMLGKYEQQMKYQQQQARADRESADRQAAEKMQASDEASVAAQLLDEQVIPVHEQDSLAERCKAEICPTCPVKTEADDTRLRALAEMDNFKKRMQREKDEALKYAAEPVLADLLPALDNLELAIRYAGKDEASKDLLMGVTMTHKLLLDVVKQHGLVPVGEEGEPFSPDIHEAVAQEERPDMPAGHVTALHQRGYMLKERLLRPAKVSVSRAPAEQA